MKRTVLLMALSLVLVACGGGSRKRRKATIKKIRRIVSRYCIFMESNDVRPVWLSSSG